jgi:hypothetical protein
MKAERGDEKKKRKKKGEKNVYSSSQQKCPNEGELEERRLT